MQQRVDAQLRYGVIAVIEGKPSTAAELFGRHGLVKREQHPLAPQSLSKPPIGFFKVHSLNCQPAEYLLAGQLLWSAHAQLVGD